MIPLEKRIREVTAGPTSIMKGKADQPTTGIAMTDPVAITGTVMGGPITIAETVIVQIITGETVI